MKSAIRILIIEDELVIAEDLAAHLETMGYEILDTLTNGQQAIELAETEPFDLLIADITIKGKMDGIETVRQLRERKNVPTIFLTAHSDDRTLQRAMATQPAAYMVKPYKLPDLKAAIEVAISQLDRWERLQANVRLLPEAIFVKKDAYYQKVGLTSIEWVRAEGNFSKLMAAGQAHLLSFQLGQIEKELRHLIRVHRSWLINPHKVDSLRGSELIIGSQSIPVGKGYREEVMNVFRMV